MGFYGTSVACTTSGLLLYSSLLMYQSYTVMFCFVLFRQLYSPLRPLWGIRKRWWHSSVVVFILFMDALCIFMSNFHGVWPLGVCLPGIYSESAMMVILVGPVLVSCVLSFILLLCATFFLWQELRVQKENRNEGTAAMMQDMLIRCVFYGVMLLSCLASLAYILLSCWSLIAPGGASIVEQRIQCLLMQELFDPGLDCSGYDHVGSLPSFYFTSWPFVLLFGVAAQVILSCHHTARQRFKNLVHLCMPESATLEVQMADHMKSTTVGSTAK